MMVPGTSHRPPPCRCASAVAARPLSLRGTSPPGFRRGTIKTSDLECGGLLPLCNGAILLRRSLLRPNSLPACGRPSIPLIGIRAPASWREPAATEKAVASSRTPKLSAPPQLTHYGYRLFPIGYLKDRNAWSRGCLRTTGSQDVGTSKFHASRDITGSRDAWLLRGCFQSLWRQCG
jgi:hypothetical protein